MSETNVACFEHQNVLSVSDTLTYRPRLQNPLPSLVADVHAKKKREKDGRLCALLYNENASHTDKTCVDMTNTHTRILSHFFDKRGHTPLVVCRVDFRFHSLSSYSSLLCTLSPCLQILFMSQSPRTNSLLLNQHHHCRRRQLKKAKYRERVGPMVTLPPSCLP